MPDQIMYVLSCTFYGDKPMVANILTVGYRIVSHPSRQKLRRQVTKFAILQVLTVLHIIGDSEEELCAVA